MFHVPETARDTTHPVLGSTTADGNNGVFRLNSPEPGWTLFLLCSDSSEDPSLAQWEHVSIHAQATNNRQKQRCPTWKEMCYIKRLCWDAEDVVMQLHPRESEYVNCHPFTLHLWRPIDQTIPEPPKNFVG